MRKPAALVCTALLAGCMAGEAIGGPALPPGSHYVAMGSSFAAGPGLGAPKPGTPERCARSAANYATLIALRLSLELDDQSCSGAATDHVLGPWAELPPQIDAVTADTRLVTVTIGGNDLNYVGNLFAASCTPGSWSDGSGNPAPCPAYGLPDADDYAALEDQLRKIADGVKHRAPDATLVFVQYVQLVPKELCADTPLDPDQAKALRALGQDLARSTAKVAGETGALLLPADSLSASHAPCQSEPWALGMPQEQQAGQGAPWHPNAAGMRAIADALETMLGG